MAKTQAHEALFSRVAAAADVAGGEVGAALRQGLEQAREGLGLIQTVPQIHARRFANLLCDIAGGALLAESKGTDRGDLVAERYAQIRLRQPSRFTDPSGFIDHAFDLILNGD
jgi:hypothetical protein